MLSFKFIFTWLLIVATINKIKSSSDDEFDYDMTSTCTTQENGICTIWQHSGKIKKGTIDGCFPESSYVITLNGLTQMKYLHIGDHLLSYDIYSGSTMFSEMSTWFHFVRNETLEYIILETKDGTLTTSPSHNIGYSSQTEEIAMFSLAINLNAGENLIGFDYFPNSLETTIVQEHTITKISKINLMGMYAPYTRINNYFVSDDGKHFYLAHSYAVVENPVVYEYVVGKTFDMLSTFVTIDESQNTFLNPIAKSLHSVFQLYEDPVSALRYLRTSFRRLTSKSDDDEIVKTSVGNNVLEIADALSLIAHTHISGGSNQTSNGTRL